MITIHGNNRWTGVAGILCLITVIVIAVRRCRELPQEIQSSAETLSKRERPAKRPDPASRIRQASAGKFESTWRNPRSKVEEKVRMILIMEAVPSVSEEANRVTATINILAHESAEIWRQDARIWEEMTPAEFADWRGGSKDTHAAIATLTKTADRQMEGFMIGDGTKERVSNYNETESGINITLDWEGDALVVQWSGAQTERKSERIEIQFSERFQ